MSETKEAVQPLIDGWVKDYAEDGLVVEHVHERLHDGVPTVTALAFDRHGNARTLSVRIGQPAGQAS
jgi:hypothetical protein